MPFIPPLARSTLYPSPLTALPHPPAKIPTGTVVVLGPPSCPDLPLQRFWKRRIAGNAELKYEIPERNTPEESRVNGESRACYLQGGGPPPLRFFLFLSFLFIVRSSFAGRPKRQEEPCPASHARRGPFAIDNSSRVACDTPAAEGNGTARFIP